MALKKKKLKSKSKSTRISEKAHERLRIRAFKEKRTFIELIDLLAGV